MYVLSCIKLVKFLDRRYNGYVIIKNMSSKYLHIFTDGIDKLLIASIYFQDWGDKNAFLYYTNNKLRGYILKSNIAVLSQKGVKLLRNKKYIKKLFTDSEGITKKVLSLHENLHPISVVDLRNKFKLLTTLLQKSYALYFSTEEYMTNILNEQDDADIIKDVGKFRLKFMETNVLATEDILKLSEQIGKIYGYTKSEVEFFTIKELINLPIHSLSKEQINKRKNSFLMFKKGKKDYTFVFGDKAKVVYEEFIKTPKSNNHLLRGMGVNKGTIKGKVYLISLSDNTIKKRLEEMPKGSVLVTESTQPIFTPTCYRASAIITDEGGVLSHAAIIAREIGIPCVVGTREATEILHDNQMVEVDGEKGTVKIIT